MPLPTNWGTAGNMQFPASAMNTLDTAVNVVTPTVTSQALSATTLTMTIASTPIQIFTGTTQNQVVTLPATAGPDNQQWLLINQGSTATVTCNGSTSGTPVVIPGGAAAILTATSTTPTTAANWQVQYGGVAVVGGKLLTVNNSLIFSGIDGKTLTFNNTLTFAGTDGTTMTFPTTNATIARTDAANTFTGVQTMTSPNFTTPVLGTPTSGNLANCTFPTLNQNTSGTAAGLSSTLAIGSGGTNATTAAAGLANLAAAGVPNTLIPDGILNANSALQSLIPTGGTAVYVTNSQLGLPATLLQGMTAPSGSGGTVKCGTVFRWKLAITKTTGTATLGGFTLSIVRGVNGTIADTADIALTSTTMTAVADVMVADVQVTVLTTGATGSYFVSAIITHSAGAAAGFGTSSAAGVPVILSSTVSSVAMNTASLKFGLSFLCATGGTLPTVTVPMIQANAYNID